MVERLTHPGLYAVVAELDGRVVGSNFLDEGSAIAGLRPITVAPTVQNRTIGRHLMQDVLERAAARHSLGVRLVLASYHARALSLYAKLGFTVRDIIARVTGAPLARQFPGIRCGQPPWPISMPVITPDSPLNGTYSSVAFWAMRSVSADRWSNTRAVSVAMLP
jgi:hypothetical protein